MNIFPANIQDKAIDEQIGFVRGSLDHELSRAMSALAPYRGEARFILPLPLHVFHQALRERDATWAKESLIEILDSLREAFETRLRASMDGIFIPYPHGAKEIYSSDHVSHAFKKVIFLVAPALIKIACSIAGAKRQEHVPHTTKAKEAWHKTSGILRRINGHAREEVRILEYALARRKTRRATDANRESSRRK